MKKITKQSKVTLVELPPTQFGIFNGDLSFDVYSKFKLPPRSLPALQGVLKNNGWGDTQSINPIYHGVNGRMTSENLERIFDSDVLMLSSITRTSPQTLALAANYKQINPKGIVIAGGPDPTFRTSDWLNSVDVVVRGEGEKTISELMDRIVSDRGNLDGIDGISFKKVSEIINNDNRELMTSEELSSLPLPFYDKAIREGVVTGVIETSRGCPNDCDFCSVTEFYGKKHRTKLFEYVTENLKQTQDIGRLRFFLDDNLVGSPSHAIPLLEAIASEGLNNKFGVAQSTVRAADNEILMNAMAAAGIKSLCVGIESINDNSLKTLNKPYSATKNKEAIKKFRERGFWIHGMMIAGADGDTYETLRETSEWANKNLDSLQLFPLTPLPGTRFYKQVEDRGDILTKDWSLYDCQNVVVRPKNFTPYELQEEVSRIYESFYSVKNSLMRLKSSPQKSVALGLMAYNHVSGGMKKVMNSSQAKAHLEFLKSVS